MGSRKSVALTAPQLTSEREAVSARNSVYAEAEALYESDRKGKRKDDPAIIRAQMESYKKDGYQADNGLVNLKNPMLY